jgi:hypothetical protein
MAGGDAIPADQADAGQHDDRAGEVVPAQALAQEHGGPDGAQDRNSRWRNDRAMGERREGVATGLQEGERRAAQQRQEQRRENQCAIRSYDHGQCGASVDRHDRSRKSHRRHSTIAPRGQSSTGLGLTYVPRAPDTTHQ